MTGLKFKLTHKRAGAENWNTTPKTQRKRLVAILKEMIAQLGQEPVPLNF